MAEAGTLCINEDVEKASGANASATADVEAYTNVYILMAEGFVCAQSRYDWVTNYAGISAIGKEFLREITSSWAAIKVINYNMANYSTKIESQVMLDVLWSVVTEGINLLRDEKFRTFILNGVVA